MLPIYAADLDLASGQLVQVLPQIAVVPEKRIYVFYVSQKIVSAKVKLFVDYIGKSLLSG